MSMTDIANLPEHLKQISLDEWNKLFDLTEEIEQTKKFGIAKGGEKLDDGSFTAPYWETSEVVDKFFKTVHNLGIVPVFDWVDWEEGKKLLTGINHDFDNLDVIALCKLITLIIRADRFNDGFLITNFENGAVLKIIKSFQNKVKNNLV